MPVLETDFQLALGFESHCAAALSCYITDGPRAYGTPCIWTDDELLAWRHLRFTHTLTESKLGQAVDSSQAQIPQQLSKTEQRRRR